MSNWRLLPGEHSELYSPIGLRLVDDLTERAPIGSVEAFLDISEGIGLWRETDIKSVKTLGGVITWPGLERHADPVGRLPQPYRARIVAEFYHPFYRKTVDGIEFSAYPWNDNYPPTDYTVNPPQAVLPLLVDVKLAPAINYPFPTHVRILRGVVIDSISNPVPVPDVEVRRAIKETVLTDENGTFALPLRWTPDGATTIDAIDYRNVRVVTQNITLPNALSSSQTIAYP